MKQININPKNFKLYSALTECCNALFPKFSFSNVNNITYMEIHSPIINDLLIEYKRRGLLTNSKA